MIEKISVAVIVTSLANKGPIKVVQTLVNTSMRLGLPVAFTVFYLKIQDELSFPCEIRPYTRSTDLSEFHIVHTHGIRPDFIAFKRRRFIHKHVVTIHNYVYDDLRYAYNRVISLIFGKLWTFLWRKADLLITISYSMKCYYKKVLNNRRIQDISNGIALRPPAVNIGKSDIQRILAFKNPEKILIGSVCAVTKLKGLDQILAALASKKQYQFLLIGEGKDLQNLIKLADRLKITDRCLFLGYRIDAHLYFQHFDIFAMPSRSEGFGLTLLEAARVKLPIVCSDIPTFREIFSKDEAEFFELENIRSLESALERLWKNKETMAANAHAKFINQYTDEIMALKYFSAYSALGNETLPSKSLRRNHRS